MIFTFLPTYTNMDLFFVGLYDPYIFLILTAWCFITYLGSYAITDKRQLIFFAHT